MKAAAAASAGEAPATPSLARRMAAFTYEGVLLFGVVFLAGLLYAALTQQRHALQGRAGLLALLGFVLAAYFIAFWTRGGQTVAMRAWQIRLVDVRGGPVSRSRALARFLASWLWFAPALVAAHVAGLRDAWSILGLILAGVIAYALLACAHPQRQFWHDALCGTRLVHWRAQSRA